MKLFKKKKQHGNLNCKDIILITLLNMPKGASGEHIIHQFIYNLANTEPYLFLLNDLKFSEYKGLYFSLILHDTLENTSRLLVGDSNMNGTVPITTPIYYDYLRFDAYEAVLRIEAPIQRFMGQYEPKIFYLSPSGGETALEVWQTKMTNQQKQMISNLSRAV